MILYRFGRLARKLVLPVRSLIVIDNRGARSWTTTCKNYRTWDAEQNCHGAVSPREALPEDDLVFFLIDLLPQIDPTRSTIYYAQLRGQPRRWDVTMMVKLSGVYAYWFGGVCSGSRKIAAACEPQPVLSGSHCSATIRLTSVRSAIFCKIHVAAFLPLFLEVLHLVGEYWGWSKLGEPVHRRGRRCGPTPRDTRR